MECSCFVNDTATTEIYTDTLFPYTTLFRSQRDFDAFRLLFAADVEPAAAHQRIDEQQREVEDDLHRRLRQRFGPDHPVEGDRAVADDALDRRFGFVGWYKLAETARRSERSEERRVGKECVSTGRSRGSPEH